MISTRISQAKTVWGGVESSLTVYRDCTGGRDLAGSNRGSSTGDEAAPQMSWERHRYLREEPDDQTAFMVGANTLEIDACKEALSGRSLKANESVKLQQITGCRTFGEFRRRVLSTHPAVDQEASLVLIEALELSPDRAWMSFRVYLRAVNPPDDGDPGMGTMRRQLDLIGGVATHCELVLKENFQGQGIATHLVQSQEEAWAAAGYKVVRLVAGLPGGWLHWAQQGYDFDPEFEGETEARNLLSALLDDLEAGVRLRTALPQGATIGALRARVASPLRSWEARNLGETLGAVERAMPPYWDGLKVLDDSFPGHKVAAKTRAEVFRSVPVRGSDQDK